MSKIQIKPDTTQFATPDATSLATFFSVNELNINFTKRHGLSICQKLKLSMATQFAHQDATSLATFFSLNELNRNFSKRQGLLDVSKIENCEQINPICYIFLPRCNQSRHVFRLQ